MKTRRRKKRSGLAVLLWLLIGVPVIVVLLLALANWVIMPLVTRQTSTIRVPDLVGKLRTDAASTLATAKLRLGDVRTVTDTFYPPDHVVSQFPPAGRLVKPGREVSIDVSRGANRVVVPNVVGVSYDLAQALLEEAGFLIAEVESLRTANIPAGQVIAIRPPPGTEVSVETPLVLAIAAPLGSFPMPNLLGMDVEAASGIIASQGLVLGETRKAPSDEPVGLVLVQYPEEGMAVNDGDTVSLIISSPPLPDSQP